MAEVNVHCRSLVEESYVVVIVWGCGIRLGDEMEFQKAQLASLRTLLNFPQGTLNISCAPFCAVGAFYYA